MARRRKLPTPCCHTAYYFWRVPAQAQRLMGARALGAGPQTKRCRAPSPSACDLFPRPALTCVSICSCVAQVLLDHSHAMAMVDAGANFVGGCCRVTASQIRTFRKALAAAPQGQLA